MTESKKAQTMAELLLSTKGPLKTFSYGEVVEGVVTSTGRNQVFVDLRAKSEGIISNRQNSKRQNSKRQNYREPENISHLKVGETVVAKVVQSENDQGYIVLSLNSASAERSWRRVMAAEENGEVLEVLVTDDNKGGLVVDYQSLSGFIPFSHLLTPASPRLGQTITVKVIETDRALNRIVFSEKLAAFSTDADLKNLLKEVAGQKEITGEVLQLLPFGAVMKVADRLEGFLHVSEMSWQRVGSPEEVLSVGDRVPVSVLGFDEAQGRLSLSRKRLGKNPWETVEKKYQRHQKVTGTITKIVPFGAFLKLPEGVEGLIHVSETTGPLKVGETVEAVIINFEPERQKLGLSIKRLKQIL